jgi:TonB family protein
MPWNPALWFQARRLRLAIEMDCDARVLRAHPSAERYGMLLLTIAQRRSVAAPMFAPMLSEPSSQLERRILAMGSTKRRLARLTAIGATVVAASVLLFACALQSDNPVAPRPLRAKVAEGGLYQTYFEFQVTKPVQAPANGLLVRYPDMLRTANVEGEVLAQFVVDTLGIADMREFKVLKSSHDLFTAAVKAALPSMQFTPAELNGRKVKQLVQMPFQFNLSQDATPRRARGEPIRVTQEQTYFEYQVESKALPKAQAAVLPRYPDALRAASIEGVVLAQFVVDTSGQAVMETFKVLKTSHDGFTEAVRTTLPDMRFTPALVGGRPVKQLVQMPFTFSLSR